MKKLLFFGFIFIVTLSCTTTKLKVSNPEKPELTQKDTIRIANEELHYEIIIFDAGFNSWLASKAKPRTYYSLPFLENKNYLFVTEWNARVLQPQRYDPNLYEMRIDYDPNIHYGLEVNYLLYNYFVYFQNQYKQKL
ncbi:DUF6146 family protein [Flavobacterium psychrotolerans]|uniref:Lipoprotein n=1 Tax=Flavobacterium psychrotolerans TaxID=2169410 RepID=A0A2U1JIW9_9FLAO|nr:DUF6146 family protein [Flavobacterium psychrotolerans]PWA05106.1 hypothetical protein DB895_08360 [Flavobacterium psychrotolerans]